MTTCCEPVKPGASGSSGPDGAVPPGRRVFLFHIGLPKTGSTSIQHALVSLADPLRARGIWVPYDRALYGATFPNRKVARGSPQTDGFAHFFRVKERRPQSGVDWPDMIAQFLRDGQARTFVVSHENMSQAGSKLRGNLLSGLAAAADIRFLVYLRAPLSYLSSYCLQLAQGPGGFAPRAALQPLTRYLAGGYAGLLARFEGFGQVDARNFDALRRQNRLLPDFFAAIGAGDLSEQAAGLKSQNIRTERVNLTCVFMALKRVGIPDEKAWFALRDILYIAGEALEEVMQTSFLPASIAADITARWEQDKDVIATRYGVRFDEPQHFIPGPDRLSFSAEYAGALHAAAAPELSKSQRDWLTRALALADQDLEAVPLARKSGQKKSFANPITGESIMSDEVKTKVEVSKEDTAVLARAMFKAQSKAQSKKAEADSGDKATFKSAKAEMLPLARRTLKVLKRQGYVLSK